MPEEVKLSSKEKAQIVNDYAASTTSTDQWWKHLGGLVYTDGVRLVAETCGAYWLLDLVASYRHRMKGEGFAVWVLSAPAGEGLPWVIEAWNDTPNHPESRRLVRQEIEYSDFPVELCPFKLYQESGVLLMPEER